MARRNVPITPGSGDNVDFDGNTQVVKLAIGPEGTSDFLEEELATKAAQVSAEAKLDTIVTALANLLAELQQKTEPANTQAVSAAALPLPTGAATADNQTTGNTALADILTELTQKTEPGDVQNIAQAQVAALAFYPAFTAPPSGEDRAPTFDEYGAQFIRGGVTTDEGSFRLNFPGSSTSRSIGTCTFTNGSRVVTGTGGFSTTVPMLQAGDYVRLTADGNAAYARVYSIDSDTALTLEDTYTGAGGTGAADEAPYKPTLGTGGSVSVASGLYTLTCGTSAAVTHYVVRAVDYGPLIWQSTFNISQRIANQDIYRGLFDAPSATMRTFCRFRFTGTTNTSVICETGSTLSGAASGTDVQTTTVTLPNGATTANNQSYRIELRGEVVTFYVNDIQVAQHRDIAPGPYDVLMCGTVCENGTTPASSTNVNVRTEVCNNIDSMRVSIANQADNVIATPQPAQTFTYSVAGVIAINTDLLIIDCSQIAELSIHCQSMGTTGVVTAAWSNTPDFAGPTTATLYSETGASSTTFNAAVLRKTNRQARFLRLRLTTATTGGTTTIVVTGYPTTSAPVVATQPVSGTVTATGVAGAAAHDAAISGNPVRVAGRALTSNYTPVATGDVADEVATLVGAKIVKQFSIPEAEFVGIDDIANSTTAKQIRNATASNKNYVTGLTIATDALGAAGEIQLRSTPVASTTATIASNTLVMAATYNWKVGDLVYVTASTVTGLTAGNYYYLLTVSAANLTFSATRGGSTLAISGTTVSATLAKILWRTRLQTTSLPLQALRFPNPVDGGTNLAIEVCTPAALASGRVDFNVHGYVAP